MIKTTSDFNREKIKKLEKKFIHQDFGPKKVND